MVRPAEVQKVPYDLDFLALRRPKNRHYRRKIVAPRLALDQMPAQSFARRGHTHLAQPLEIALREYIVAGRRNEIQALARL